MQHLTVIAYLGWGNDFTKMGHGPTFRLFWIGPRAVYEIGQPMLKLTVMYNLLSFAQSPGAVSSSMTSSNTMFQRLSCMNSLPSPPRPPIHGGLHMVFRRSIWNFFHSLLCHSSLLVLEVVSVDKQLELAHDAWIYSCHLETLRFMNPQFMPIKLSISSIKIVHLVSTSSLKKTERDPESGWLRKMRFRHQRSVLLLLSIP